MLNEDIKKQLKNEDLTKIDIHKLAMDLYINNISIDFNNKYIDKILEYIDKDTKLEHKKIPTENGRNPILRIISTATFRNEMMIANSSSSLEITIFNKIKTIFDNEDYFYNTRKTLIIFKNSKDELELFKFRYTIFGSEDEREYLNYYFTSLTNDKRNEDKKEYDIYSDVTVGNMFPVINEIMINNEIQKEFFEVLELTQDLKNSILEVLFEPMVNIESKNKYLKELLTNKTTIKNTMVKK